MAKGKTSRRTLATTDAARETIDPSFKTEWQVHVGLPSIEIHVFFKEEQAQDFAREVLASSITFGKGNVITQPRVSVVRVVRHFHSGAGGAV